MKYFTFLFLLSLLTLWSCKQETNTSSRVAELPAEKPVKVLANGLPDWAVNANIYEVNIRQYTPEGTLSAFTTHLPRLKEMGVDILWLMPINPISEEKRKGSMGSYYAVDDYKKVNPEFGTDEDLKNLIRKAHDLDMYIILDWVANHTGWGNPWIKEHPDWYTHRNDTIIHPLDESGELTDWYDVADLNYEKQEMRAAMIDALAYWVDSFNIDGYRCDVTWGVEDAFWKEAWEKLRKKKALFTLAEAESPGDRDSAGFNMSYAWSLHHRLNEIAKGEEDVNAIDEWLKEDRATFPQDKGFHMQFTSNHDENSWNGTVFERMGDGHKAFAVLTATFDGMPLIYSGQEEPMRKRLRFFEKDTIGFSNYAYADFYKKLLNLKKEEKALWNGKYGGEPVRINESETVYAFKREKDDSKVVVIINLSDQSQDFSLTESFEGLTEVFSGVKMNLPAGEVIKLRPWAYLALH
jgi:glycosidase